MKCLLLDTNVYISAILFGGVPKQIIDYARNKKVEIIISEYILWEIREVLRRKFMVPDSRLNIIEHDILSLARLVAVRSSINVISDHPADNAILAAAVDGHADFIISGDKHLLSLEKFKNIPILSPRRFLSGK